MYMLKHISIILQMYLVNNMANRYKIIINISDIVPKDMIAVLFKHYDASVT